MNDYPTRGELLERIRQCHAMADFWLKVAILNMLLLMIYLLFIRP